MTHRGFVPIWRIIVRDPPSHVGRPCRREKPLLVSTQRLGVHARICEGKDRFQIFPQRQRSRSAIMVVLAKEPWGHPFSPAVLPGFGIASGSINEPVAL